MLELLGRGPRYLPSVVMWSRLCLDTLCTLTLQVFCSVQLTAGPQPTGDSLGRAARQFSLSPAVSSQLSVAQQVRDAFPTLVERFLARAWSHMTT